MATEKRPMKATKEASLAAKIVRTRTGSGVRLTKSRRSGKSTSHSRSVTMPKRIMTRRKTWFLSCQEVLTSGENSYLKKTRKYELHPTMTARTDRTATRRAFIWSSKSTISFRKSRPKKCFVRIPAWANSSPRSAEAGRGAGRGRQSLLFIVIDDPVGGQARILVDDQLAEDLGQRGEVHEGPQVGHGIVGHDAPLMKDDDPRADLFGDFEHMGGIDDDLVLPGQPLDQVPDDEPRRHVQAGEGLVQQEDIGIMEESGRRSGPSAACPSNTTTGGCPCRGGGRRCPGSP